MKYKMKKLIMLYLIGIIGLLGFRVGEAKTIKKVAQTGMQFLRVDMVSRAAAMGGAFTMAGHGTEAIFYNPGALSQMNSDTEFFVSRVNWIADIAYSAAAVARDFGNFGTIGLHFIGSDYGEVIGTMVSSTANKGFVETGTVDVGAYVAGASYSRTLTNKFRVGGTIKYASQHLGANIHEENGSEIENRVSGLAYDFGTVFYPGLNSLRLGVSFRNFSPQLKYEETAFELPLTFRIGIAADLFDFIGGSQNHAFLVDVDALHPRDYTERVHLGAEYVYRGMLALRAGYKTNYDEEGLSMGFGINYELGGIGLRVDYAYSTMGMFNDVNRFTIGGTF